MFIAPVEWIFCWPLTIFLCFFKWEKKSFDFFCLSFFEILNNIKIVQKEIFSELRDTIKFFYIFVRSFFGFFYRRKKSKTIVEREIYLKSTMYYIIYFDSFFHCLIVNKVWTFMLSFHLIRLAGCDNNDIYFDLNKNIFCWSFIGLLNYFCDD